MKDYPDLYEETIGNTLFCTPTEKVDCVISTAEFEEEYGITLTPYERKQIIDAIGTCDGTVEQVLEKYLETRPCFSELEMFDTDYGLDLSLEEKLGLLEPNGITNCDKPGSFLDALITVENEEFSSFILPVSCRSFVLERVSPSNYTTSITGLMLSFNHLVKVMPYSSSNSAVDITQSTFSVGVQKSVLPMVSSYKSG